jgi:small subunit ribosomal protein S9
MTKSNSKNVYTSALGRRRTAVVTVKLFSGKANSTVNGIEVSKYFPSAHSQVLYQRPFLVTETQSKYYFQAKVTGGGKIGQLSALSLAISRSLKKLDDTAYTPLLRTAGLLTVDSRVRQRRMVGTGGKARRQKQSPKR